MPLPDASHRLTFPDLPDVHAWIEVDGQPLQVYAVEVGDKKVVAYVEATDGKQFEVHYLDLRSTCATSHVVRLYGDGLPVNSRGFRREASMFQDPPDDRSSEFVFEGSKDMQTSIRPFKFSSLQLTDDDNLACSDERVVKNIGTIQLKYMRVKNLRSTDTFKPEGGQMPSIHEKTKKAQLSHQVGFGAPVNVPKASRSAFEWIDNEDDPFSMLEFRYRSRALLEAQGIVDVHSPSNTRAQRTSPSPSLEILPARAPSRAARLAALEEELAELERAQRIAQVKREIALLKEGEGGACKKRKVGGVEDGGGGKGKGKARGGDREGCEME